MFYVGQKGEFSKTITEYDVYGFAGISGDFNPVHINEIKASESIFTKRIVHGILVLSYVSTVIGMYMPGPGTIYMEQNSRFVKPVYIGDTITASVEIVSINERGHAKLITEVFNQKNEKVLVGEAVVKLPKKKI